MVEHRVKRYIIGRMVADQLVAGAGIAAQRAAQGNIDFLKATADAKHRFLRVDHPVDHRQQQSRRGPRQTGRHLRILAIARGRDIRGLPVSKMPSSRGATSAAVIRSGSEGTIKRRNISIGHCRADIPLHHRLRGFGADHAVARDDAKDGAGHT